jgi:hypothetical protein
MACRFDAVSERMAAVERALAEAQADRGVARRDRYAAWQAYGRASAMVGRLQCRVHGSSSGLAGWRYPER